MLTLRIVRAVHLNEVNRSALFLGISAILRRRLRLPEAPYATSRRLGAERMNAGAPFDAVLSRSQSSINEPGPHIPTNRIGLRLAPQLVGEIMWSELVTHEHPWGLDIRLQLQATIEQVGEVGHELWQFVTGDRAWLESDIARSFARETRFGVWTFLREPEPFPEKARFEPVSGGLLVKRDDGQGTTPTREGPTELRPAILVPTYALRDEARVGSPRPGAIAPTSNVTSAGSIDRLEAFFAAADNADALGSSQRRLGPPVLMTEELPRPEELARLIAAAEPRTAIARSPVAAAPSDLPARPPSRDVGAGPAIGETEELERAPEHVAALPFREPQLDGRIEPPELSLQSYARFRAELRLRGEHDEGVWRRFGVGSREAKDALQSSFAKRFRGDPAAQSEFVALVDKYAALLAKEK